jgi:hypothetical protein
MKNKIPLLILLIFLFSATTISASSILASSSLRANGGNINYFINGDKQYTLVNPDIKFSSYSVIYSDNSNQGQGTLQITGIDSNNKRIVLNLKYNQIYAYSCTGSWYIIGDARGTYYNNGIKKDVTIQRVWFFYNPISKTIDLYGWGELDFRIANMIV